MANYKFRLKTITSYKLNKLMKYITILLLFISQLSFGQSASLTKIVDQIDYQTDTLKAVYDWITDNIKYDVKKLKELEKGVNFFEKGKYKSTAVYKADQLEKVIKKKKGVCDDYTLLFDAIVTELGYTSYIVEGITKGRKGKVNKNISHSWNAVKDNGTWKLYDPTWGAGYVKEHKKFVKKYFGEWYDVNPEEMKERHLPFDPIWQLSDNPISYKEFENGTITDEVDAIFDYEELITAHLQKSKKEQMTDELARSELNGGNIKPIKKRRKHLQNKISFTDIPEIIESCRASSEQFSEYLKEGKNKRFRGEKWTMEYSKKTLEGIKEQLLHSVDAFRNVKAKDTKSKKTFKKNINLSKKLLKHVEKELDFLSSMK